MRSDRYATAALTAFLGFQLACATAPPMPPTPAQASEVNAARLPHEVPPDWIQAPAQRYPAQRYLTGVGSGIDPATAESRAKALIAEIFSARIESTTSILETERTTAQGSGALVQAAHQTQQSIRTTAHKELSGVRIAESFRDADGLFWALAVLDRRQAQKALIAQIQALDRQIADALAEGATPREGAQVVNEPGARLDRARCAMRIATALQARAACALDLGIVAMAGTAVPAPEVDPSAAERWADRALRELRVAISGEFSEGGEVLSSAIATALTELGLNVELADAPADLRVEVTLALAPPLFRDGWHWARGSARVNLVNAPSEALLHSFEVHARKSSTDEVEAGRRLVQALGDKVLSELRAALAEALR